VSMLLTVWVLTGDIAKSTGITIIVQVVQTIVHAAFETTWDNVQRKRRVEDNQR
jgi:uncharacterized membrane protein